MAEIKNVPYGTTGDRPRFSVRGWDDERVFVDVACPCGADFWSDPDPVNNERGALHLECAKCRRQYRISLLGAMIEPEHAK